MRAYKNLTIVLELPGDLTIFEIDWFSIFDVETKQSLASIIIPEALNVPPSLVKIVVSTNVDNRLRFLIHILGVSNYSTIIIIMKPF